MPRPLTPKQCQFCHCYVECGNASEAYRRAYNTAEMKPESVHRKAFELLENPKVSARIEELQAEHRRRHAVTVDSLTADARDAIQLATETKSPSAYVQALTLIAKLHGLGVERREVTNKLELSAEVIAELEQIAVRADAGMG